MMSIIPITTKEMKTMAPTFKGQTASLGGDGQQIGIVADIDDAEVLEAADLGRHGHQPLVLQAEVAQTVQLHDLHGEPAGGVFICRAHSFLWPFVCGDCHVGLVVKASASRAEGSGFESRLRRDFFRGRVIPVTQKLALQWLPCQAPGVIGSALGLVGPVSVYCD